MKCAGKTSSPFAAPLLECVHSKCSTDMLSASVPTVDCGAAACKVACTCSMAKGGGTRETVEGPGQVPKLPPRLGGDQPGCHRPPAEEALDAVVDTKGVGATDLAAHNPRTWTHSEAVREVTTLLQRFQLPPAYRAKLFAAFSAELANPRVC